jgi:hypothetical protein
MGIPPRRTLVEYGLRGWPFREVPDPAACDFIAGRPTLRADLSRFLAPSQNPASAIYLFWASLGAGKTHALYYLMSQMTRSEAYLPIYSEYPEAPATFAEIYANLGRRIDWRQIADLCLQVFAEAEDHSLAPIRLVQPDIYRALWLLAEGERTQLRLATRWLRAESLSRGELREAALSENLTTPGECAGVISTLARLLALRQRPEDGIQFRLVWIIDECQRLGSASPRLNHEVNAGLQTTFNQTPNNFTIILSFTGKPEPSFPTWLRPELADRIGTRNILLLPPFSRDEAKDFMREVLAHFRQPNFKPPSPFHPFTAKSLDLILDRLLVPGAAERLGLGALVETNGIRPRALIKYCHAVLAAHSDQVATIPITDDFVRSVLPR